MRYSFLLFVLLPVLGWTQENSKFELGLQLDNDSFASAYNDFYYTNGIFVFANYVSKKSTAGQKIIHGLKIGQQIYNPRNMKSPFPEDHNRPYAGYLFAEYNTSKMFQSNSVLGMSFRLGIVGPDSKAEDFQRWMHNAFGFGHIIGWEQQIHNLVAVQVGLNYSKPIFATDKMDLHFNGQAEAGTAFSSAAIGTLCRISLSKSVTPMQQSSFYNGLGTAKKEFYFYILPKLNLQFYDATIQGSLFNHDSPVTFNLNPLRFKGETGLKFKYSHYNLSCAFNYITEEIKNNSATGYYYGSLIGSYAF
ncbi:lipid A deacylase LpxR family protein [Flavobacterium wongokense]|uniref:lipid A deacylase LpxR family protein n=1 Tax=Flavobacterium wongokense TaxID=2910674 RepID=UPI001F242E68|nr:lipid A deacylase LpxR family protein [Flavobacterium sp. WG47]MCF6131271.1 lipid A deacylase LpxR family protein [Flavobacterium sp. WG47]